MTSIVHSPLRPNLFVIGASKSGSSALHRYLSFHPRIRMSDEKEPCFFVEQSELREAWPVMARRACSHDEAAYLSLFAGGEDAAYRGEASVYYSQSPHRSGVPARIAAACPDARIVYIVKEPVSRAIAHYWQRAKEFQEPLPLGEAFSANPLYRDTSDYAYQLERYLRHFSRDQIHIVIAERLKAQRRQTLDALTDWLGLERYAYTDAELAPRHVSPPTSRRQRFPFVRKVRDSKAWSGARRVLPSSVVDRLRKAATAEFDRRAVDDRRARDELTAYLSERTMQFTALFGAPVPEWQRGDEVAPGTLSPSIPSPAPHQLNS